MLLSNRMRCLQPALLTVTASMTPSLCNGANGTSTANPVGGTAPYTYQWNTNPVQTTQTAINLAPGIYTVTVTDACGNTGTATDTVTTTSLSLIHISEP